MFIREVERDIPAGSRARGEVSCVYEIMSCGANYVYFERVCVGASFIWNLRIARGLFLIVFLIMI